MFLKKYKRLLYKNADINLFQHTTQKERLEAISS